VLTDIARTVIALVIHIILYVKPPSWTNIII